VVRPPALLLLAYRLLGWRVGPAYREWVHEDLTRRGWLVRQGAPVMATLLALGAVIFALADGSTGRLMSLLAVLAGGGAFLRNSLRERALRQQGIDASGEPVAPWYADDAKRARRNWVGAVGTVAAVVGGLILLAVRTR
jgi:hypothetical protein